MKKKLYLILPIIAGICWGTQGIFVRILSNAGFDNITIIFSRSIVAIMVISVVILITDRRKFKAHAKDLPLLMGIGFAGVILLSYSYNIAVLRTSLSLAAVLLCLAPIFVLIFSVVFFGEKLTRLKFICMLAAIFGCILLSGLLRDGGNLHWDTVGFFFGLGSAIANAAYTVLSKMATKQRYDAITIFFYSFLFVTVVLAPFADWKIMVDYLVSAPVKVSAIYLTHSVWTSLLPALFYTLAVQNADAGRTAILASGAEPVSSMLAGLVFYHEIPSPSGIIGMIITIIALIILVRPHRARRGANQKHPERSRSRTPQ
ncbi:MAG: DMT family transporter [Bacillota bacterium]|nr:DMT family transporter [Bacillota bacterium]